MNRVPDSREEKKLYKCEGSPSEGIDGKAADSEVYLDVGKGFMQANPKTHVDKKEIISVIKCREVVLSLKPKRDDKKV